MHTIAIRQNNFTAQVTFTAVLFAMFFFAPTAQAFDDYFYGDMGDFSWYSDYGSVGGDSSNDYVSVGGDSFNDYYSVGGDSYNDYTSVGGDNYNDYVSVGGDAYNDYVSVGGDSFNDYYSVGGDSYNDYYSVGGDVYNDYTSVGGDAYVEPYYPIYDDEYIFTDYEYIETVYTSTVPVYVSTDYVDTEYVNTTYIPTTYIPTTYIPTTYIPTTPTSGPTCSLVAHDTSIEEGEETSLSWVTTHAQTVTLSPGFGTVDRNDIITVSPDEDTTYRLTVYGTNGTTVTCTRTVTVDEDEDDEDRPTCRLTISPRTGEEDERRTLSWDTTDATDVRINQGIGEVSRDGDRTVRPDEDTTYRLTAENSEGSVTCEATARVEDDDDDDGDSDPERPRCTLRASDRDIRRTEEITLSWETDNANDVTLKDSHGRTLVNTRNSSRYDEDEDDITVRPTRTTEYTLRAIRGSRDRECTVTVRVGDAVSVSSTRTQDPVTAIELSEVPYTGFEAGPILTTIFYTLLVLWGAGIAYVLMFKGKRDSLVAESTLASAFPGMVSPLSVQPAEGQSTYGALSTYTVPLPVLPELESEDDGMMELETYAHSRNVLLSSDALRFILSESKTSEERRIFLDSIIDRVKAKYPSEDGWTVLNRERLMKLFS